MLAPTGVLEDARQQESVEFFEVHPPLDSELEKWTLATPPSILNWKSGL